MNSNQKFDIRNFINTLEPAKELNKYICPVCGGNNLSVEPETGKYQCFNGCECWDIREKIKPWAEVIEERRQKQGTSFKPITTPSAPKAKSSPKAVPLPSGELAIARLSEVPRDIPQAVMPPSVPASVRRRLASEGATEEELKQLTAISYDYGDSNKVHRWQCPCATDQKGTPNPKGSAKTFTLSRIDKSGKEWFDKGSYAWAAYREAEALTAVQSVGDSKIPVLFSHEGEKCVERGRQEMFAGITTVGSASSDDLIHALNKIKNEMGERPFIIAHLQDNDPTGIEKAKKIARAATKCSIPFVAVDLKAIKPDLCDKGDIADILASGMTGDELAQAILKQIDEIRAEQHPLQQTPCEEAQENIAWFDPNNPDSQYADVARLFGLNPENCVTDVAFDTWVYNYRFGRADDWRVIDSAFYRWEEEQHYWQHQPDSRVATLIADAGEEAYKLVFSQRSGWQIRKPYGTNNNKESAFKYVRSRLERPEPLPTNTHLLGFRNCVVDLRTGQQIPHSKDYFLTNLIPYDYKAGKECPEVFRQFVTESFGEDMLDVVRAFTGMFLDPTAPFGRFPHLIGQSGGGKGTLGRFWSSLFGEEGSGSAAQFADISTPEGRHQYLTGKRIFGFPDLGGYVQGVRAFYELVDNGSLSGRALFNPVAYSKQWYVRFWAASVDHLQIENAGDGWQRRAYPIPTKSRDVVPDPNLRTKLEAVKADVISWALSMPREERDRILLAKPESERALNLVHDASLYGDSTRSFMDLCLRPTTSSVPVSNAQLHTWYVAYCREHGYTPLGMSKFINHAKTVLSRNFKERCWTPMVNGHRERIAAHWTYLAPIPGVFITPTANDFDNDVNPLWICDKAKCEEGGLFDFEEFWQPKQPEPSSGAGVQGVQGTLERKKEGGQAETQSQTDCPGCPSVQSESSAIEKNANEQASQNLSSNVDVDRQSRGEQGGTPWTPPPNKGSSLSTHENTPLDKGGQGGQVDMESDSAISTSKVEAEIKKGDRVTHADPFHARANSNGVVEATDDLTGGFIVNWVDDGINQRHPRTRTFCASDLKKLG